MMIYERLTNDLNNKMAKEMVNRHWETFCFGDNRDGACGLGEQADMISDPKRMKDGHFKEINFGFYHAVGIDHQNVMYSWGKNTFGQTTGD